MAFNLIRITRSTSATTGNKRAVPDVSATLNKHGDLLLVLSPAFFAAQEKLAIGSRILVGYDPDTRHLALIPAAATETASVRTIRKRPSLEGAGTVCIKAADLPEGLIIPSIAVKRTPVAWVAGENNSVHIAMDF